MTSFVVNRIISGAGNAIAGKAFNSTTSSCDVFSKSGGNQPCCTVEKDAFNNNLPYCGPGSNVTKGPMYHGSRPSVPFTKKP